MSGFDDLDSEDYLNQLLKEGQFGSAANYLKRLAALRREELPVHAVNCRCLHCKRERLDVMLRLHRERQRLLAVAA
ncbi:hypothetical protein FHS39_002518 [Streptomyces olivoverticillatus]|uniref:Uncharacterized protein n=1 Tax=Streptomyces olivoverticillatus TaxID=66427 RepID=A0A7W7LNU2_9ACTN|nr:hypothetical protein [Streptomyces olivoverticillatus]MBB4893487.1 hypothetical protein [Streptomyces olivoverticillatus]